jgi:hypothetical protein
MKKMIFTLALFLVFFSLISGSLAYQIDYIMIDDTTSNHYVFSPSIYYLGSCSATSTLFATTTTGTSYSLNNVWYSPDNTTILTGTAYFASNLTCYNLGSATTTNNLNNYYEAKSRTISTATTTKTWLNTTYTCEPINDYFTFDNSISIDSYGYRPNEYTYFAYSCCGAGSCGSMPSAQTEVNAIVNHLNNGFYAKCGTTLYKSYDGSQTVSCGLANSDYGMDTWAMIHIKTGVTGSINMSIIEQKINLVKNLASGSCSSFTPYLWDKKTNGTTALSSIPYISDLVLTPDNDYWVFVGTRCSGHNNAFGSSYTSYNYTNYTVLIYAYEPAWICGNYSDCINGTKYRTCHDPLGKITDRVEYEACYEAPFASKILGFEESYTRNNISICVPSWFCLRAVVNLTSEYPVNWTVSPQPQNFTYNFIKMTSEIETTEGVKSLKMWYIPPKIDEVYDTGTGLSCTNATMGVFPYTSRGGINQTMFVELNVTFPSPYMTLSFDIKKCASPVIQYQTWLGICGNLCYAQNCSETPLGRFGTRLTDTDTSSMLVNFYGFADTDWKTYTIDLSNAGIETGHNYTLTFAVNPENEYDINSHCIYIDNVKIEFATSQLVCESDCIANDPSYTYRKATSLASGACIFDLIPYYTACIPSELQVAYQTCEDHYCDCDTNTYFKLEGTMDNCTVTEEIPNSVLCVQECETQAEEDKYYTPIIDTTQMEEAGAGWTSIFFMPIFLTLLFIIGISGAIAYKTKSWQFGIASFIGFLVVFSVARVFPAWIAIILVVITAVILAKTVASHFGVTIGGD